MIDSTKIVQTFLKAKTKPQWSKDSLKYESHFQNSNTNLSSIKIIESNKVAVPNLISIVIIVNAALGLVEIQAREWNRGIALKKKTAKLHKIAVLKPFVFLILYLRASIKSRASSSSSTHGIPRHVVDHKVNKNIDPNSITPVDHVNEGIPVTRP